MWLIRFTTVLYQRETPNLCSKEKPPICVPMRTPERDSKGKMRGGIG